MIYTFLMGIRMPSMESYIMNTANPKRVSTIFGISYAAGQHGTGILAPLLGYLIDNSGYVTAYQIVAILSLIVTLILGPLLWRTERNFKIRDAQTAV